MQKIMTLTQEQFNQFKVSDNQEETVKEMLSLPEGMDIAVGDTAVKIDNAKPLEVYKTTWKDRDYFYIVINSINEELAYCYSIYPCY